MMSSCFGTDEAGCIKRCGSPAGEEWCSGSVVDPRWSKRSLIVSIWPGVFEIDRDLNRDSWHAIPMTSKPWCLWLSSGVWQRRRRPDDAPDPLPQYCLDLCLNARHDASWLIPAPSLDNLSEIKLKIHIRLERGFPGMTCVITKTPSCVLHLGQAYYRLSRMNSQINASSTGSIFFKRDWLSMILLFEQIKIGLHVEQTQLTLLLLS